MPEDFTLLVDGPYPNPFSERTNFSVTVDQPMNARIAVWDMLGREIAVVHDGRVPAGFVARSEFQPTRAMPAGVYILQVQSDRGAVSRLVTRLP
ncbi:MAG: T9SS type A sorting domain-containing protein [Rhodothermia bacterium]|nr:T9SS type A sorting domain-containing protein [Rhodothermia bacterium]